MEPPPPHSPSSSSSSSYASFPILAISILGILTTSVLLLSYYIFVTKCCLNCCLLLLFRQRSSRRHPLRQTAAATVHHLPEAESRGLDSATISSIPTFRYSAGKPAPTECAVCLSYFQHGQLLRLLPNCSHAFHVDCIDTWLQSNDNCPLCRSAIQPYSASPLPPFEPAEATEAATEMGGSVPRLQKSRRKMESKGDEWIDDDTREKVQPIRRSFSMDSSNDRQLYVSVQEILWRNPGLLAEGANGEGSGSIGNGNGGGPGGSGRIRWSLFSFGRSSTRSNASVLPL